MGGDKSLFSRRPLCRRILDVFGGLNVGHRDGRREILVQWCSFYFFTGTAERKGEGAGFHGAWCSGFTSVPRGTDVGE